MNAHTHVTHPFPPLFDENARTLILGSLPSVKSREQKFFYGHPQNRFWPLLAALFHEPAPATVEEKAALARRHGIALWDTIYSCEIVGSGDSSIKNVVPTDLSVIFRAAKIERVFCNGRTSGLYYAKYHEPRLGVPAVTLPSTSPANAAWTMEKLFAAWRVITES
ncbi:MAG: DNA-deoxyinosine glycosylase [Oscillospiraceae bacterium]|nr:DNA-deoxyinosine glycosylase [Oscillospiraceae bacterium]